MIKLVIFDLDGVIIDLKDCHYQSLNDALSSYSKEYTISQEDHYKFYDGLPTRSKLKMLTTYKSLSENLYESISKKKQEHTLKYIYENVAPSKNITETFEFIKSTGAKICVASNSVSNTIYSVLTNLKVLHHVDAVFSNENVSHPKPNPEIYFRAISHFGLIPSEALILEDSPYGLEAAHQSGSHVLRVRSSNDVTVENIAREIEKNAKCENSYKWKDKKMNVLIPMAGAGSRFEKAGYTLPKPLIDVAGKTMISRVVDNLNLDANYTFIVQKSHEDKYQVSNHLRSISPSCKIVTTESVTEGAACTVLLAKDIIDTDEELIIANSDQFVEWNSTNFYYKMASQPDIDASIVSFKSTHPKWSYARLGEDGCVVEVAEKNPISDIATVGIYYWRRGKDFVKYAESMIEKNIRVNNEFYVAPVFNEAVSDRKKIVTYEAQKMWGLGTPEDLDAFLASRAI
jgi:HAD superfamily hydrolase (TIGR01509 family)